PIDQDVAVTGASESAFLGWTDDAGRRLAPPRPALYQRVFGPAIPAYSVRTPDRPGSYHLVFSDSRGPPRSRHAYRIVAQLPVAVRVFPARPASVSAHAIRARLMKRDPSSSLSLTLVNTSRFYLQSQVFREHLDTVSQTHPGMRSRWPRANAGALV